MPIDPISAAKLAGSTSKTGKSLFSMFQDERVRAKLDKRVRETIQSSTYVQASDLGYEEFAAQVAAVLEQGGESIQIERGAAIRDLMASFTETDIRDRDLDLLVNAFSFHMGDAYQSWVMHHNDMERSINEKELHMFNDGGKVHMLPLPDEVYEQEFNEKVDQDVALAFANLTRTIEKVQALGTDEKMMLAAFAHERADEFFSEHGGSFTPDDIEPLEFGEAQVQRSHDYQKALVSLCEKGLIDMAGERQYPHLTLEGSTIAAQTNMRECFTARDIDTAADMANPSRLEDRQDARRKAHFRQVSAGQPGLEPVDAFDQYIKHTGTRPTFTKLDQAASTAPARPAASPQPQRQEPDRGSR